jgi:hypothetical protein
LEFEIEIKHNLNQHQEKEKNLGRNKQNTHKISMRKTTNAEERSKSLNKEIFHSYEQEDSILSRCQIST